MLETTPFFIPCISPIIVDDSKNALQNIRYFRRQWKWYCIARSIDKADENIRVANLLLVIGKEANELILNQLNLTEAEKNNSDSILNALEHHFLNKMNIIHMRYLFNQLTQDKHENIESYLTKVKQLGNHCDFEEQTENMIRDRFVVGLKSQSLKEELIKDCELTLKTAVAISKGAEATNNYFQGPNPKILKLEKMEQPRNDNIGKIEIMEQPINNSTGQTESTIINATLVETTPTITDDTNINVKHPSASTTPDNTVSTSNIPAPKEFNVGSFLLLKSDYKNGPFPPIWKIDGNSLLQKYSPFKQDTKTLYKNTGIYNGWTLNNSHQYFPIKVKCKTQNRKEHVIEFNKNDQINCNVIPV